MSSFPPLGYDDSTFIPSSRLRKVVSDISAALETIQKVSKDHIPDQMREALAVEFDSLTATVDELHMNHLEVVDKVLKKYRCFLAKSGNLESLQGEVENLRLFIFQG